GASVVTPGCSRPGRLALTDVATQGAQKHGADRPAPALGTVETSWVAPTQRRSVHAEEAAACKTTRARSSSPGRRGGGHAAKPSTSACNCSACSLTRAPG